MIKRISLLVVLIYMMGSINLMGQTKVKSWQKLGENDSLIVESLSINSARDDCTPLYIDGVLYFSSTRINIETDEADLKYNENIYTSSYIDSLNSFSKPKKWYFFNNDDYTALAGMSTRGPQLFTYKTFGNGDLYSSVYNTNLKKQKKSKWSRTKRLKEPINTDWHEQSVSEANGIMVISSERPGGQGEHDLYWSKINIDGEYTNFYSIDVVNTDADEVDVSLSKDGKDLYFSSNSNLYSDDENSGYNIFSTTLDENKHWTKPKELEINTSQDDRWFMNCDSMFFVTSSRDGGSGGDDLYWGHIVPKHNRDTSSIEKLTPLEAKLDTNLIVQMINLDERPTENEQLFFKPDGSADTLKQKKLMQIYDVLDSLKFEVQITQVQVGAYYYLRSVDEFRYNYQSFDTTDIVIEKVWTKRGVLYKYMINKKYKTLKESAIRQQSAIDQQSDDRNKSHYPKGRAYDAFIVAYNQKMERIIIYFDVEHDDFKILMDGKKIKY